VLPTVKQQNFGSDTDHPSTETDVVGETEAGDRDDYGEVARTIKAMRQQRDPHHRSELRSRAIERCLPLADHVARRFSDRGEPFDDLVQVARIGVVHSVDRFDPERGTDFLSLAVPTVMGEVRRYFRDTAWTMRVPRRVKETSLHIGKAVDELTQRLGRSPRPSELADELGTPVSEVIEGLVARSAYRTDSIDAERDDENRSLGETLGERDGRIAEIDDLVTVRPALDELPERERQILTLRFFHEMSQSEIAREVGLSQMHVSRLLSRSLAALRKAVVPVG